MFRYVLAWTALRVVLIAILLLYPFAALAALPWAWFASLGCWGYTPLAQLREEVARSYSLTALRDTARLFFSKELP